MTQDQFCDGVRLLGGKAQAARALAINERAIERTMSGRETLGDQLARELLDAIEAHRRACADFVRQFDGTSVGGA